MSPTPTPLTKEEADNLQDVRSSHAPFDFLYKVTQLEAKSRYREAYVLGKWMQVDGLVDRLERRWQARLYQTLGVCESVNGYGDLGEMNYKRYLALITEMKEDDAAAGTLSPKKERQFYELKEKTRSILELSRDRYGDRPPGPEPEDD